MKSLLLWDIDGTLIDSGGAGERALRLGLERAFGINDDLTWLEYAGRTDVWIARTILVKHFGATDSGTIQRFLNAYLTALEEKIGDLHGRVLSGIRPIMDAIKGRTDIAQGLLTGNLRRGAEIKLTHFDLWTFFPFGAFADDAEHRDHLGPHALRRARAHHGEVFAPANVFVIGDTPHDIACGNAIGANTVAVATGRFTCDQLRSYNPSIVVGSFAEADALLSRLK